MPRFGTKYDGNVFLQTVFAYFILNVNLSIYIYLHIYLSSSIVGPVMDGNMMEGGGGQYVGPQSPI